MGVDQEQKNNLHSIISRIMDNWTNEVGPLITELRTALDQAFPGFYEGWDYVQDKEILYEILDHALSKTDVGHYWHNSQDTQSQKALQIMSVVLDKHIIKIQDPFFSHDETIEYSRNEQDDHAPLRK